MREKMISTRAPEETRRTNSVIAWAIIWVFAAIAGLWIYGVWYERIPADADAIVNAEFAQGRSWYPADESIISAIERLGDVNGFSAQHQSSLLYAAVCSGRNRLVTWLLEHGANPNPKGPHPLLASVTGNNETMARRLLKAGGSWTSYADSTEPGKTVLDVARQENPVLVEKLTRNSLQEEVK